MVPSRAEDFAKRVRRARKQRELSQAELSVLSEINPATIYRLEAGRSRAYASTAHKLAKALKVDAQWLLTGDESRAPTPSRSPRKTLGGHGRSRSSTSASAAPVSPENGVVPFAMWNMLGTHALSLGTVSPEETKYLRGQATQERVDADRLQNRLLLLRVEQSNYEPRMIAALNAALTAAGRRK